MSKRVAIIGYGYVGKAYHKVFPDAVVYDEPQQFHQRSDLRIEIWDKTTARNEVNQCDMALIAVPTDLQKDGSLDTSIVEEVVGWLETPLILIKSALMPGTVDRLVRETGKQIAVSVETVGEGKYYIPEHKFPDPTNPLKHQFIIVGGEEDTATKCAEVLWERMSPDVDIHITSAVEAEICKLMENAWGAMKVTFANNMREICDACGANFVRVLQAWGADGRVEKMHMRSLSYGNGWSSKCWDKDVPALKTLAESAGIDIKQFAAILEDNQRHKGESSRNG